MRKKTDALSTCLLFAFSICLSSGASYAAPSAEELARKSYAVSRFDQTQAQARFEITTKSGSTRKIELRTWTKLTPAGQNMRLARFTAPADLVGTATLTIERAGADDDIWVNLPALGKVRRMLANSKKDSYLGTDFTFGDIIGYRPDQWTHKLLGTETVDGSPCYILESVASETAAKQSGFSRRINWVRQSNYVPAKGESYDLAGRLVKIYAAASLQEPVPKSGQWQPMRIEAKTVESGRRTTLIVSDFRVNTGLKDNLFTPRSLEDIEIGE